MGNKLLEGIRVVDITVYVTGPLTTKAFSDCGAEVIKIETAGKLAGRRQGGVDPHKSGYTQFNTNKLGITLNFATPKGLELAKRLVAKSDIVIENLAGGVLAKRGLGYEELKKVKPDIIMLSACMQGQTGPHYTHAASGHKLSALSGFNQIYGWPDRPPSWIAAYTDTIAPRYNIIAILAALDYRRRTGKGQYLDMSQYEGGLQFMAPLLLDYAVNSRVAGRMGNQSPYAAPHNAYRCLGDDRWCAISVFNDEEWRNFCGVIGKTTLADNPRFNTLLSRKENEEELDCIVNEWTSSRSSEEVMTQMQAAGVAAGVVETPEDQVARDPQLKHRRFFREVDFPGYGKYLAPVGAHSLLSKTDYELRPGPLLGEHNDYVYKDILGLSSEEIASLSNEEVIS